jgi:hypothetical protein
MLRYWVQMADHSWQYTSHKPHLTICHACWGKWYTLPSIADQFTLCKTCEWILTDVHIDGKKQNANSECSEFLHFLNLYIVVGHSNEPIKSVLHPGTRWCRKACAIKQVTLFPALNSPLCIKSRHIYSSGLLLQMSEREPLGSGTKCYLPQILMLYCKEGWAWLCSEAFGEFKAQPWIITNTAHSSSESQLQAVSPLMSGHEEGRKLQKDTSRKMQFQTSALHRVEFLILSQWFKVCM